MPPSRHRVQLVLFLAAVFVPCAVLVALSLRIVNQDRELRGKRQADEQQQVGNRAARDLRSLLDAIQSDEIRADLPPGGHYRHPETVFVAWAENDRLVLPWEPERDLAARSARDLPPPPCGQPEVRSPNLPQTEECYQTAIGSARNPLQAANARWLWAQTLQRAGQQQRAAPLFQELLDTSPEVTDGDGIPLKLHAAQSLLAGDTPRTRIAAAVESVIAARPWLPPLSSFVVTDIATRLAQGGDDLRRQADARVRLIQQAESLQSDYPRLRNLLHNTPRTTWAPYGDDPWLVAGVDAAILVVRSGDLFHHLNVSGAARFADSRDPAGLPLGESFPGLKLVLNSNQSAFPDPGGDLQRGVLYLALLLVVAATVFAAYLLWRDLQRELRVSELRAQFVASVSHELKTPLTAIRMFAETLQLGRYTEPAARDEYLGTIVNECERLSRLVDGVLLFSKMDQGKRIFRFRPVQAAEAVRSAVRTLEYPLAQEGFRLHLEIPEDLPMIHADRDALEQAVLNLLSNAMKFSADARDIELALSRQDGEIAVRVTDHGIGISADEQSRIFDKFYRAPTPENRHIPGTGLGLALVAQILKAHGGRVSVESAPGKGSTFSLCFPLEPTS
jgi:signal transduction histidine kinase